MVASSFGIGMLFIQSKLEEESAQILHSSVNLDKRIEYFDNMKIRMSRNASKFELKSIVIFQI